ncbi:MAG: TetR family transcriptional regulator [Micromonosporaceae bacterium]|nr:TetR family transcriptional regulator [Micromonosporaceae bacterium]
MATDTATAPVRTPLTRQRILDAALDYIDRHGLEGLSMHKLGAELGVKGMSLYNHVTNKNDLRDGVVELLWSEAEAEIAAPTRDGWSGAVRSFAHALRDVMRRHPNAAPLMISQQVMPAPALRIVQAQTAAAASHGIAEAFAHALLRTITSYALGSGYVEVGWGMGGPGCSPSVSDLLRPGIPAELAAVAQVFCGQSDPDAQFQLGLDLMLRGLDSRPEAS